MSRLQGTVKWFSNKKGYGFITPAEGSTTSEDIFVHQSSLKSDGYRTLDEGWQVEFDIGHDDDGKVKAENVTAPGGGPCTGVRSSRRRRPQKPSNNDDGNNESGGGEHTTNGEEAATATATKEGGEATKRSRGRRNRPNRRNGNKETNNAEKVPQSFWHDTLSEDVKSKLSEKSIRTSTGTVDISVGTVRIKLGTRGYASIVSGSDKSIAEGSFECDENGNVSFEWKRAIQYDGEWKALDDLSQLLSGVSLVDGTVGSVGGEETMSTLMGDEVSDPKPVFEQNGFEMRRVVLTTKRR
jgi:protein lin-28